MKKLPPIEAAEKRYYYYAEELQNTFDMVQRGVTVMEINADVPTEVDRTLNYRKETLPQVNVSERILENDDLLPIVYLRSALARAKSVARIVLMQNGQFSGFGTGFLISPDLLLTNNHVLADSDEASSCLVEFNYEMDLNGTQRQQEQFRLAPQRFFLTSPESELDFTIVAIEPNSLDGKRIEHFGYIPMVKKTGKILKGQCLTVIQHPEGDFKKIAFRENYLLKKLDNFLIYKTDTAPGSSGAPVFNDFWELVAVHHAGVPEKDADGNTLAINGDPWQEWMGEDKVKWKGNEGIRISQIIEYLEQQLPNLTSAQQKLAKAAINDIAPPLIPDQEAIALPAAETSLSVKQPEAEQPQNTFEFEVLLADDDVLQKLAFKEIKKRFSAKIEPLFLHLSSANRNRSFRRFIKVEIETSTSPWDVARQLINIEGVEDADPILEAAGMEWPEDRKVQLIESSSAVKKSNKAEIEKRFPKIKPDWNQEATNFPAAIQYSQESTGWIGHTGIKVAQIDTGYSDHPEIAAVKRESGFDYVSWDQTAKDERVKGLLKQPGHGTRTGGVLIGGDTDLARDFNRGVFPYVDFIPFRVANSVVIIGTAGNVQLAVLAALQNNCSIITMSMGSYGRRSWRQLAKHVYDRGVIWVCAAGNEVRKLGLVVRPAYYPGTIAVAATNYQDKDWPKSSRGEQVDIAAPGENVYVPVQLADGTYDYNYGSGTSYATPHIAGAAALWLNHHRDILPEQYPIAWQRVEAFRTVLRSSARVPANWDPAMGAGILDAKALLETPLPAAEDLQYAYGTGEPFAAVARSSASISERELFFHWWNRSSEGAAFGMESWSGPQLSEAAQSYLEAYGGDEQHLFQRLNTKC